MASLNWRRKEESVDLGIRWVCVATKLSTRLDQRVVECLQRTELTTIEGSPALPSSFPGVPCWVLDRSFS
jgi:hypothetical protein